MSVVSVAVPLFILAVLICIAVPVMIGIYVAKDAKARNMNAALWVLIALFAPGFIGLIIYLIVRNDRSALKCPSCGASVKENFSVCPMCGASLKNACERCGYPLEGGWVNCPNCAEPIPPEKQIPAVTGIEKKDKGLSRVLAAVIAVPLALVILMISCGAILFTARTNSNSMSSVQINSKEEIESKQTLQWLQNCDKQGKGTYVFSKVKSFDNGKITGFLIYRNDGSYDMNSSMGSLSNKLKINIDSWNYDETGYSIYFFETRSKKDIKLEMTDNVTGSKIDYILTDGESVNVDDKAFALNNKFISQFGFSSDTDPCYYENINTPYSEEAVTAVYDPETARAININIDIPKKIKNIKEIAVDIWVNGESKETSCVSNEDNSPLSDVINLGFEVENYVPNKEFSFNVVDMTDKLIFESKKFKIDDIVDYYGDSFYFTLGYNENGKLDIVTSESK